MSGGQTVSMATEAETEHVCEYFEWQAPDLEVTFLQKVYCEAILNTRHDVSDTVSRQIRSIADSGRFLCYAPV